MRIRAEDTAIIAIDYQEKLMPAIHNGEQILEKAEMLLRGAGIFGVPCLMPRQYPKGLGDTVAGIREAAGDCKVVDKIAFSACQEPEVMRTLETWNRKNILVCGVEAHVCVLQTVIDLAQAGYRPVLVCDCISSRTPEDREIALVRAQQEGAILTTAEAILFELAVKSGTPAFKELHKIVK